MTQKSQQENADKKPTTTRPIFRIYSADANQASLTNVVPTPEEHPVPDRNAIPTEADFASMSPEEKYKEFQSQAYEIKQLRRKIRKMDQKCHRKLENDMHLSFDMIKQYGLELADQGEIIQNLIKATNQGKLIPNTLPYNRICTILRDKLQIPVEHSKCYLLKFPEKTVAISKLESEEYNSLAHSEDILRLIIGDPVHKSEGKEELHKYLQMQAQILKKMTYSQFVKSLAREK